jgi:hypothetical protein
VGIMVSYGLIEDVDDSASSWPFPRLLSVIVEADGNAVLQRLQSNYRTIMTRPHFVASAP